MDEPITGLLNAATEMALITVIAEDIEMDAEASAMNIVEANIHDLSQAVTKFIMIVMAIEWKEVCPHHSADANWF